MRIGVIIDGMSLARWQADALRSVAGDTQFLIYSCRTAAPAKRRLRHAGYYLLNLFTIRNRITRSVPLPDDLNVTAARSFAASCSGAWQSLPDDLLEAIRHDRPDVLIKFGMGLLKVPPSDRLAVPILSFHHGDPARFRGRPAGFYEQLDGEATVGQIVQILTNRLDSGPIVAAAETRVVPHSYRATLIELYRHSPLLLGPAISNAVAGTALQPAELGRAYRLPGNATVLRFLAAQARQWLSRLLYGLTREKRWHVATAPLPAVPTIGGICEALNGQSGWTPAGTPAGYRFIADPFFHPVEGLLVEGMSTSSSRGELVHLHNGSCHRLSGRGGHFSYPCVTEWAGRHYIVPEVSAWSPALAFPLGDAGLGEPLELDVPGRPALLDPTLFVSGDDLFLFANLASEGHSVLRLWVADSLGGAFTEHASSPVRISPDGSRMAGQLQPIGGRLVRIGQDLRRGYGDGISFFHVKRLDRDCYEEELAGHFRFHDVRGPHTLNLGRGMMTFDYYRDIFFPMAGFRRLRDRKAARQPA